MKRSILTAVLLFGFCVESKAHNVGNAITWNREISRIIYQRCASCHREGGTAFSLMKYPEVQPRAVAIKEAVLSRQMPPWGAVKGFGDFQNDKGLSQAELELITDWVDSDTPKGNNPNVVPKEPKPEKLSKFKIPKNAITASGDLTLDSAFVLGGLLPEKIPSGSSAKIIASLPDGHTEPLLWLYEYKDAYQHPFLFRAPIDLPAGTVIRGVPSDAEIVLIPGKRGKTSK
jgi:mono/diheme cytochrome c family protein